MARHVEQRDVRQRDDRRRHEGRAAVVTGAAQGIGHGIAERLIRDGARVVAVDRNADALVAAVRDWGGPARAVVGDVSVEADCARAVDTCVAEFGRLDLVVANAAVSHPRDFLDIDADHWRRHQAVNLDGAFYCARDGARAMVAAGTPGAIVFTSSINGFHVEQTMASYNVTKGALLALVRSVAIDLARYGIRANAVAPGVVDTPLAAFVIEDPELGPRYRRGIPLGRFGTTADVAAAVSWLASDEASYITGQTVVIDGGQTLGIPVDLTAVGGA